MVIKKDIKVLKNALDNRSTAGEVAYELFETYLPGDGSALKGSEKTKALKYLKRAVAANYPDALTCYGRSHWGDWLVKNDDKKALKFIKKGHELGSDWGTDLLSEIYFYGIGTKKNFKKAFNLRDGLTEDYSGKICCALAMHYMEGEGVSRDTEEGYRLLEKAMKMGEGKAYWEMSKLLCWVDEATDKQRFKLLKESVKLEEPYELCFLDLADCYFYGDGTKQNFDKVRQICEYLLKIVTTESQEELAHIYLDCLEYNDPKQALDFVPTKRLAEAGFDDYQNEFGSMFEEGEVLPQDFKEALKWYKRSAEQGNLDATHNMARIYHRGIGVRKNHKKAFELFRSAANNGYSFSQNVLGSTYETGFRGLIPQDYKEAVKWYRLSAKQGDAMGQNNLGAMYHNGTGVRKNLKKAMALYQSSAKHGCPPAINHLGFMHSNGEGVPKNEKEAIKYYRRAAKMGYPTAQYNLGLNYIQGNGLKKSNIKAYICFYLGSFDSNIDGTPFLASDASSDLDDLSTGMIKSDIAKAKKLAKQCMDSDYKTWAW